MGQSLTRLQQWQDAQALRELAPQKDPGHDQPLPILTRDILIQALQNVASSLSKKNRDVIITAFGCAVNTVYLQSCLATHDLDFFNDNLATTDLEVPLRAAKEAVKHDKKLDEHWFNNRTIFFIPKDQRAVLTEQALRQREIMFTEPGLSLDSTLGICLLLQIRPHSWWWIMSGTNVPKQTIHAWLAQYSLRWTAANDHVLTEVNARTKSRVSFAWSDVKLMPSLPALLCKKKRPPKSYGPESRSDGDDDEDEYDKKVEDIMIGSVESGPLSKYQVFGRVDI
ncbi:hypothetical protein UA08_08551 [Talaromyces atroroseus]|uniref:Uncharacterized protein n=1 Tax=Talaromyces atroroseus TaxID=1441469 RepID=A0A1Q5Q7U9_TALAT|nr:hypothetical protein UA08_08551 [Talaromyces atroroseus]OKL56299.1 hypothetical protein UA08_08551 [Talaromyces atroroseus]